MKSMIKFRKLVAYATAALAVTVVYESIYQVGQAFDRHTEELYTGLNVNRKSRTQY